MSVIDRLAPISIEFICKYSHWCTYLADNFIVKSLVYLVMLLYSIFFVRPLAAIYFSGPSFGMFGMWGGDSAEDICSKITTVSAAHWVKSPENLEKCYEIIGTKFQSFLMMVQLALVLFVLYKLITLLYYWCIEYPLLVKRDREKIELKARLEHQYRIQKV